MEKFVSIDFETSYGHIPCSIGLAVFENGILVDTYYTLIKPIDLKFNPINSRINGIFLEDVIGYETFDYYWKDIFPILNGSILVAHNASTDISILEKTIDYYQLGKIDYDYHCTLQISKKKLLLDNYKLDTLAKFYSIKQQNYHNALDDAIVCGELYLKLKLEIDKNNLQSKKSNLSIVTNIEFNLVENYFKDKTGDFLKNYKSIVVSGVFSKFSRNDLENFIQKYSNLRSSISGKTDLIIAGANMGPAKLEKATKLGIPIWSEEEFISQL